MTNMSIPLALCLLVVPITFTQANNYYIGASYLNAETEFGVKSKFNSGFDIHIGYEFNSSFLIELAYLDLGSFEAPSGNKKYLIDSNAVSFSGLYTYPIDKLNLIGKLGYLSLNKDVSNISQSGENFNNSDNGLFIGAGISYKFSKTIELKTEFNIASNTNFGTVGFNYHF